MIDVVMTTVYRNTVMENVATTSGYVAKRAEDRKFLAGKTSPQPISVINGGLHILVPFAIEDGRRLGAHAQALLRALATSAHPLSPTAGARLSRREPRRWPTTC